MLRAAAFRRSILQASPLGGSPTSSEGIIAPSTQVRGARVESWMAQAWRPASRCGLGSGSRLLPWLREKESLTARLIAHYGAVTVRVLNQGLAVPHRDEATLVGQRAGRLAWVREVLLCAQGRPLVYARSVLARKALRGDWHRLAHFGSRPLGAALFADPLVRRAPLFIRRLDERDWRHARAVLASGESQPRALWARRSRFVLGAHGLVVCEIFLAGMDGTPCIER